MSMWAVEDEHDNHDHDEIGALIETLLEIEELDENLFRAKRLFKPFFARGVFGGQLLAMSLLACCKTIGEDKAVHSMHSYFLLPGDAAVPVIFSVKRLRDGASFATRACDAIQRGKVIFSCLASFHRLSETSSHRHQTPMPTAPHPEYLPDEKERGLQVLADPRFPDVVKEELAKRIDKQGPIDIRYPVFMDPMSPGVLPPERLSWLKAHGKVSPAMGLMFHQCIAAYASDFDLCFTSVLPTGRSRWEMDMMVSLDHAMWFHAPFRADEWLLYSMKSTRLESNRGLNFGQLFRQDGTLAVTVAQEGLVRLGGGKPPKAKL